MSATVFKAPWGRTLKLVTTLSSLLLLGISGAGLFTGPRDDWVWWLAMVILPLLIWGVAALSLVRSYRLDARGLSIQRLLWRTPLSLAHLQAVQYRPHVMRRSFRILGNGGLFGFTGYFRNRELGTYRAFVTDLEQTVVLTFPNRKIVLSPKPAAEFVDSVSQWQSDVH